MKFNHLQASIANNRDQMPTLYMALCMVESLFSDLEEDSGVEIGCCPVGDERLPIKMIWLCRTINEIYQNNSEDLQRNRARLDAAVEKLKITRKQLEESAGVAEELARRKAEYAALEAKVRESRTAAEECEVLRAGCAEARKQLAVLQQYDPATVKAELEALNGKIVALEKTRGAVSEQLLRTKAVCDELQQEVNRLEAEKDTAMKQADALDGEISCRKEENARLRKTLEEMTVTFNDLKTEGNQLVQSRNDINAKIQLLQKKMVEFREENLAGKMAELEIVQKEFDALQDNRSAAQVECDQLKSQRNQLVLDIAHQKTENESLQEKLGHYQKKLDMLRQEKTRLGTTLAGSLLALETLQGEVEQLTSRTIPEAEQLREQEQLRQEELSRCVEQSQQQIAMFQSEIEALKEQLPKLEEDVKNNRVVYDALTANCAASSKELEGLERQIAELRNNTAEEKLVIYRKQLEENQRELENIQTECARLEEETVRQQKKLEEGQNRRAALLELKKRYESGAEVTKKQLLELSFADREEYHREVVALEERVKLLESVRGKLAATITNMQKILGKPVAEGAFALDDELKNTLRDLRERTDDLRCALIACANSIKMEER